ncbi:MAG: NPCBM/NEW2 domain-containing protein [Planctomycetota bacterium]
MIVTKPFPTQRLVILAALLFATVPARFAPAAPPMLPSGEPDPNCPELRLWVRADSGIKDTEGRSPADPGFNGMVAAWNDRSPQKFNLAAAPGRAPLFVQQQPAAGNRPTVAFSGEQILTRSSSVLHDRPTSTMILVVQGQPRNSHLFSTGRNQHTRETLNLNYPDAGWAGLGGVYMTSAGERGYDLNLALPSDGRAGGRFAIILSNGESDRRTLEFHDGTSYLMGGERNQFVGPLASDKCSRDFFLGGGEADFFCGQVAEMIVFNRGLSSAERREMLNYLRHRYELDMTDGLFPAGTFLLPADSFEGNWTWSRTQPGRYLRDQHLTADVKTTDEGIKTTINVPRNGLYHIWVRALENDFRSPVSNSSALKTIVQGKELRVTHVRGPATTLTWREAGEVELKAGPAEIVIRGEGPGGKDCDSVLISPTAATLDAVEELCALAKRLRGMGGESRLTAVFENGLRLDGSLLTGWRWTGPSGQVSRPDPATLPPLVCLQFDRRQAVPERPSTAAAEAMLEFQNGDRLRGTICGYVPATSQPGPSVSAQLLVRMPAGFPQSAIPVEIDWLRRIVFEPSPRDRPCPPKTLIHRNGRAYSFRAIRWCAESVSVLTEESLEQIPLSEVAEVRMATDDAWDGYYRELAILDPEGKAGIIRVEANEGMVLTASTIRSSHLAAPNDPVALAHLLQPAWSRAPIPVSWISTRLLWRAPSYVVPLSRFAPQRVTQRGVLGSSWKWQVDRNVAGGILRSDGMEFLWGFGVHAPNEMVFTLPDCVRAFRTSVGIDAVVRNAGCAIAKIHADQVSGVPLYQSKPLVGSAMTVSTGEIALPPGTGAARQLILVTENAHEASGKGDELDIGNHVDWLEPTLLLDPVLLHAKVIKGSK